MPVHFPAEATCDHCGKTAPCRLDCAFISTVAFAGRSFMGIGLAIRDLPTWFWNHDALACSDACRDALARDPRWRWAEFGNQWRSCQAARPSTHANALPTSCGACGWRLNLAFRHACTEPGAPSIIPCPQCGAPLGERPVSG